MCPSFAALSSFATSVERRSPTSETAWPRRSSQSRSSRICVDRPDPSAPSSTINVPTSSPGSTPGRPAPYKRLGKNARLAPPDELGEVDLVPHDRTHRLLLHLDRLRRVHHREAVLVGQPAVLLLDPALEETEALLRVLRQAEVHAGLVVLQHGTTRKDAADRRLERHVEIERDVR